ncbi:MAG: sigma-70 family RNA polymerase sigma factor [Nannocystales bacterium]
MSTSKKPASETNPAFSAYMRDVGRHPVMTKADEARLGADLMALRRHYHRQVLSYAPYTAAVLDVIRETLDKTADLEAEFAELAAAARGVRDSNRKAPAERYERMLDDVSSKLAMVDSECIGVDRVAADLDTFASESKRETVLAVKPPRKGSRPFGEYVSRVRRASASLRNARNRFARANLRLVVRIAGRFQQNLLPLHDRVQEGNLGLMKAIDRFDPTRGFRFSTYASWWIKHAIRRAAVNRGRTIRLPAHLQATAAKVNRARIGLRQSLEREPTAAEIAADVELPLDKVELTIDAMRQRHVSLDAPVGGGDDARTVLETLIDVDQRPMEELVSDENDAAKLRGKLLSLATIEQDILRQRFGLDGVTPRTLTEIGHQYDLSRERIRQLQQRALENLRRTLESSAA